MERRIIALLLVCLAFGTFYWVVSRDNSQEYAYYQIEVKRGDTLWALADKYCPNSDIRKSVYEIKKINNLSEATIHPGEIILVPADAQEGVALLAARQ